MDIAPNRGFWAYAI